MLTSNRKIDDLPVTPYLLKITMLSSMGIFMDGYVLTIYSIAILYMKQYFGIITSPYYAYYIAIMGSSLFIGMFFGSIVLGNLSDRFGRKKLYEYDLVITVIFLLLSGLSTNIIEFIIFQIFTGIGIGADYPISSSIQAEFSPKNKRGELLVFNIFSWTLGGVALLLVSIPVILYTPSMLNWRLLYITAAVIPVIVIFSRRNLPESPFWLSKNGNKTEALKSSKAVASSAGLDIDSIPDVERGDSKIRNLFSKKYLASTVFVSIAWFSYDVSSYGVWEYTPSAFAYSSSNIVLVVLATLLEELPVFIGFLICMYLVEKTGRKSLEILGFGGAAISLIVFAILTNYIAFTLIFTFMAFAIMHLFHNIGPTNLTYDYPVEIFPTRIRGTAMGFATSVSRIGAILGTIAFPIILFSLPFKYVLIFLIIFEITGFTVTYLLAPEPKGKHLT
ncbi:MULTISPECIES: MFS transporter [Acidiplasma]|uniref:MFS transporter n=2 Tax=Acidiplasma TaxID=507753 RepID=A0A0Q0XHG5_9ARCH|nr:MULTISPECIES: MFS transporter [Acidiplasma]KPV44974.1 MFS transporter [Acidiplasma aeolicum]KQB34056.1 MFS transporter [Acidiplasma aeolicum]